MIMAAAKNKREPEYVAGKVIGLIFDKEFMDGRVINISQYKRNML